MKRTFERDRLIQANVRQHQRVDNKFQWRPVRRCRQEIEGRVVEPDLAGGKRRVRSSCAEQRKRFAITLDFLKRDEKPQADGVNPGKSFRAAEKSHVTPLQGYGINFLGRPRRDRTGEPVPPANPGGNHFPWKLPMSTRAPVRLSTCLTSAARRKGKFQIINRMLPVSAIVVAEAAVTTNGRDNLLRRPG